MGEAGQGIRKQAKGFIGEGRKPGLWIVRERSQIERMQNPMGADDFASLRLDIPLSVAKASAAGAARIRIRLSDMQPAKQLRSKLF